MIFQILRLTRPDTVENELLLSVSQVSQKMTTQQSSLRRTPKLLWI